MSGHEIDLFPAACWGTGDQSELMVIEFDHEARLVWTEFRDEVAGASRWSPIREFARSAPEMAVDLAGNIAFLHIVFLNTPPAPVDAPRMRDCIAFMRCLLEQRLCLKERPEIAPDRLRMDLREWRDRAWREACRLLRGHVTTAGVLSIVKLHGWLELEEALEGKRQLHRGESRRGR